MGEKRRHFASKQDKNDIMMLGERITLVGRKILQSHVK